MGQLKRIRMVKKEIILMTFCAEGLYSNFAPWGLHIGNGEYIYLSHRDFISVKQKT
jgi:hypothetical protein